MGIIGDWGSGSTPNKGTLSYYGGKHLWLRTGELNDGEVFDTEIKVTDKALAECSFRHNVKGDILIAMYGATIGKVAIAGTDMVTNQACCGCTPFLINNRYLFYFLMASRLDFTKKGEGGAQPNISREKLINHLIPIPPLNEQHRIVEKIETILPFVEKYSSDQIALEKLNANITPLVKKSILQEAIQGRLVPQCSDDEPASALLHRIKAEKERLIKEKKIKRDKAESTIFRGDDNCYYEQIGKEVRCIREEIPFEIPSTWEWARLGAIFAHNTGKALNNANTKGTLLPYITTSNLYWEGFVLDNIKKMYFLDSEIEKCSVQMGDLLVCEGGDVGRAAIWDKDIRMCIQNHIHKLRPYTPLIIKFYYFTLMLYKSIGAIGGKGIGIQGLSSKALHNILIPIPPISEQQRIVSKIERLFQMLKYG